MSSSRPSRPKLHTGTHDEKRLVAPESLRGYTPPMCHESRQRGGILARNPGVDLIHRVSTHISALAIVLAMAAAPGCDSRTNRSTPAPAAEPSAWFTDRAQQTGLDFVHVNGMSGERYFPEVMPPGVGLLDFDNDGDLDVYFVQGQILGTGKTVDQMLVRPAGPLQGRLFRNDLRLNADGTRTLRFVDVTAQSGIRAVAYGMGVATGDIDNDGWIDLYLTNFGSNQMYRNNHDGTFTDISRESGTGAAGFAVSASFVDYDRDGWLDLYVGEYVDYRVASARSPNTENTSGFRSRLYSAVSRAARLIFSHTSASRARRGRFALALASSARRRSAIQRSTLSMKAASTARSLPPSASPRA